MTTSQLGLDIEDLRLPTKDGLRRAAELGCRFVELPTASGELSPRALSASGRRHLSRFVDGFGLRIAALTVDVPGLRLTDPRTVDERILRTCETIEMARELGVTIVSASAGALTHPESGELSDVAAAALRQIGEFADSRGVGYALRPSNDASDRVAKVLDALRCPSLRLGVDPAALVMQGINPIKFIEMLGASATLIHARDATAGSSGHPGHETRLGEGEVDLIGVAEALAGLDYSGPIIARRVDSASGSLDLAAAMTQLKRLFGN